MVWALLSRLFFAYQPGFTEGGNIDFVPVKFWSDDWFVYEIYLRRPSQ